MAKFWGFTVKIDPAESWRNKDKTLLVGNSLGQQILEENLDRAGAGRQRCFQAGAVGGRGTTAVSLAEHKAAEIARSIDK